MKYRKIVGAIALSVAVLAFGKLSGLFYFFDVIFIHTAAREFDEFSRNKDFVKIRDDALDYATRLKYEPRCDFVHMRSDEVVSNLDIPVSIRQLMPRDILWSTNFVQVSVPARARLTLYLYSTNCTRDLNHKKVCERVQWWGGL